MQEAHGGSQDEGTGDQAGAEASCDEADVDGDGESVDEEGDALMYDEASVFFLVKLSVCLCV